MPGIDAGRGVDAATFPTDGATPTPDAPPPAQLTSFPIPASMPNGPVIAGVNVTCHPMYSPKIVQVEVLVTDPQGANDRATGSGTMKLPDGTNAALMLSDPGAYSHPKHRLLFGGNAPFTLAQYDLTCAATSLELSLTIPDETGHVTVAPKVYVAPAMGGTL